MPCRQGDEPSSAEPYNDTGESDSPRLTADNLARCDVASREAELHRHTEAKFTRPEALMSDKWRAWSDTATTAVEDDGRDQLTAENLSRHDAELEELDRPVLSAADLARQKAASEHVKATHSLRDDFDYTKLGWRRAEHREGYGGLLEPRASRRRR